MRPSPEESRNWNKQSEVALSDSFKKEAATLKPEWHVIAHYHRCYDCRLYHYHHDQDYDDDCC